MKNEPRRALVTGASGGLGAALARRFAERGIEVWLAARRTELLDEQVAAIEAAGGRGQALTLDVSDADATVERLTELDDEVGGIDLVVANAGIAGLKAAIPLTRSSWTDVRDILQTNIVGAVATLWPFVPAMLARGHGQLVGISSLAADIPTPRVAAYGASKAGLTHFLEAADMELRPRGIAVTAVHPGFIRTPAAEGVTEPMPFILSEDDAARIIDRGISRRARMIRFPWIMGTISRMANAAPRAIMAPLLRRATAERSD